jgi:hypothetical protein
LWRTGGWGALASMICATLSDVTMIARLYEVVIGAFLRSMRKVRQSTSLQTPMASPSQPSYVEFFHEKQVWRPRKGSLAGVRRDLLRRRGGGSCFALGLEMSRREQFKDSGAPRFHRSPRGFGGDRTGSRSATAFPTGLGQLGERYVPVASSRVETSTVDASEWHRPQRGDVARGGLTTTTGSVSRRPDVVTISIGHGG